MYGPPSIGAPTQGRANYDDRPRLEYSGIDRVLGRFGSARGLLLFNLSEVVATARAAREAP
ncbi:MAG: hypothetical protein IPG96_20615 [Proteobacteria bacterium]|nr:hypothetical protein [Pseudomonadota bacterium]